MQLEVVIDDTAVRDALARLAQRTRDLTPAMRAVAGVLHDAAERAFETERDPATGTPWAELAAATQQRPVRSSGTKAQRRRGARPILHDSGQLVGSISSDYGVDFAVAGTDKKYGRTHQFGARRGAYGTTRRGIPIPWGDVPARPFLGVGPDDLADIVDLLNQHLAGALT